MKNYILKNKNNLFVKFIYFSLKVSFKLKLFERKISISLSGLHQLRLLFRKYEQYEIAQNRRVHVRGKSSA